MDAVRRVHPLPAVKTGAVLRPGDSISARVDSLLLNNRVKLSVGNQTLIAKTTLSLRQGQILRAHVEQLPGGRLLRLRLIPEGFQSGSSSGNGNTVMSARQFLSASLLRAGLPIPDAAELNRQAGLLSRSRGARSRLSRLYAELRAKGADPSADFLEALNTALSPRENGDSDPDHSKQPREHPRQPKQQWQNPPNSEELADELGFGSEESGDLLNLFNQQDGQTGSWVVQRFSRRLDNGNLSAVLKFRKGIEPAMALTVVDGERLFEFLIEGLDPARITMYADGEKDIKQKDWDDFRRRLSLMNITLSDTIFPFAESDGFSPGTDEVDYILEAMS